MEKEVLTARVEKLNAEPDGKKRQAIVSGMRKESGLKTAEARELLKEAGYGVKPETGNGEDAPPPEGDGAEGDGPPPAEKKIRVKLRHKTEYPRYRRAGLVLSQTAAPYEVTESQLDALKNDPRAGIADGGK
jgi:hypothetical protein